MKGITKKTVEQHLVSYSEIPEMKVGMFFDGLDKWWNSQSVMVTLTAESQPFYNVRAVEECWSCSELSFYVQWSRELAEMIKWLQKCYDALFTNETDNA